jgi:hypothetical protein
MVFHFWRLRYLTTESAHLHANQLKLHTGAARAFAL